MRLERLAAHVQHSARSVRKRGAGSNRGAGRRRGDNQRRPALHKSGQDGNQGMVQSRFFDGSNPDQLSGRDSQEISQMHSILALEFELEIGIEELEPKVAPDGGETVLPLPMTKHHTK